ncbi:MAG: transporter [Magnetospirillum sp.]|nr:transporter [Magnetospirillum sp.]
MGAAKPLEDTGPAIADLLNYAALVDSGIVQCKDGSLLAGWFYAGPDTDTITAQQRNFLAGRTNAAHNRFSFGWASWTEAVRTEAANYPGGDESFFPDEVTAWIDNERRRAFEAEDGHFETIHALIIQFTPDNINQRKFIELFYDDDGARKVNIAARNLEVFKRGLEEFEDAIGHNVRLRRMGGYTALDPAGQEHFRDELVSFLHFCLTGENIPINIPPIPMYLDMLIGGQELFPGDQPLYAGQYTAVVAVEGFPPESYPGILDALANRPFAYRWSSRMIYLDQHQAIAQGKKFRRHWGQKKKGIISQVFKTGGGQVDEHAAKMEGEANAAIGLANSGAVTYGYYTPLVVVRHTDRFKLMDNAREIAKVVQDFGFACRIETINTMEAWLGSLPGHPKPNVRRPAIHTANLAHLLPLSQIWAGEERAPCPLYPPNSPPLAYAATTGTTPFRINLHVRDLGHTFILGPTGAGKSVLLAFLAAQFRRYKNSNICAFDKGRSMWTLCTAAKGKHYDIAANDNSPSFAPLANLEKDFGWAAQWLEICFELQTGKPMSPAQRAEVNAALKLMLQAPKDARSLTDFCATVQSHEIREALAQYTLAGSAGHLLDAKEDGIAESDFTVFEIEELMGLGDRIAIPVLLYLFRRFERSLDGRPSILFLDEAWIMLSHDVFREKIKEWLKVLRKRNCAVVLATQSISDAVRSGLLDVLIESCPTKIFLPNPDADKRGTEHQMGPADLYALLGLNEVEIDTLKQANQKQHYYFTSPLGKRLFDFRLGPIAVAFVAVSDQETIDDIRSLQEQHGDDWPRKWLNKRGVSDDRLAA